MPCHRCGCVIDARNTKTARRSNKKQYCGKCYLKNQREKRAGNGEYSRRNSK